VTGGAVTARGGTTRGGTDGVTGASPAESRFIASALRIAAGDGAAEERLALLLDRVAATAGAQCVAALVERRERRVVVGRGHGPGAARRLGEWLDASVQRKRARAADPAMILVIDLAAKEPNEPGKPGERESTSTGDDAAPAGPALTGAALTGAAPTGGAPAGPAPTDAAPGLVSAGSGHGRTDEGPSPVRRSIEPAGRPRAALAFDFASERSARTFARRFTPLMARAAADIIGPLSRLAETERELAELRHADAERRRFVSVVAHELRTPLASLTGYLDLLAPDGRGEFLDRSRDLVAGMATIVADLLELSRLEAGQLHLVAAPFSGAEAAQAAVHDVGPLATEREIALDVTLPSRLRMIHADRRRVQQVLVNLLGNAIKFSPHGTRIAISLRFDGLVGLYTVRDQGPGVPPEELELIFEPFHRASGTERVVGTGLGLPIARDLTRRMGGELDVASAPGAGSAFVVALPAGEAVDRAAVVGSLRLALERALPAGRPA
jgi:signal transduction histidine kinase